MGIENGQVKELFASQSEQEEPSQWYQEAQDPSSCQPRWHGQEVPQESHSPRGITSWARRRSVPRTSASGPRRLRVSLLKPLPSLPHKLFQYEGLCRDLEDGRRT